MRENLKRKIVEVCDEKIKKKGKAVGISLYTAFKIKMHTPPNELQVSLSP